MSETSSYFKSSIPNFGRYGDQFISMWEFGIAPNLFFSIYPAILIYLIEFQNVTFRRLAKSCERQPKAAPIAAYILALSLISGILATIVYFITKEARYYSADAKICLFYAFSVFAFLMWDPRENLRFKTKSIYNEHKKHLLEVDYPLSYYSAIGQFCIMR